MSNDSNANKTYNDASSLVPDGLNIKLSGPTFDMLLLGANNIRALKKCWRKLAEEKIPRLKKALDVEDFFTKYDTPEKLQEYSEAFDAVISSALFEALPTKSAQKKQRESCTFNFCGWCKFAELLDDNLRTKPDQTVARDNQTKCVCYIRELVGLARTIGNACSSCVLKSSTQEEINLYRQEIDKWITHLLSSKHNIDDRINFLTKLEKKADEAGFLRPSLPVFRKEDYCDNQLLVYYHKARGVFMTVKFLKRTEDGKIWLNIDGSSMIADKFDSPLIMTRADYDYLRKDLDFAEIWLRSGLSYQGQFDASNFLFVLDNKELFEPVKAEVPGDIVGSSHAAKLCK